MKRILAILSLLLITGCFHFTAAPARIDSNAVATVVGAAREAVTDRAAGNNAAIEFTTQRLPASREKEVILNFVDDQYRLLGQPKVETQTSFLNVAKQLLSEDASTRAKGESARISLSTENQKLKDDLKAQEKKFDDIRKQEEADHKAEVERVRLEGEQAQKKLISYIFFGGSALLAAGGVVVLVTASSVPMFGPKVAFGLFGASALAAGMGIAILQLMKELEQHPSILWIGISTIVVLLTGAGSIAYANHHHHVNDPRIQS